MGPIPLATRSRFDIRSGLTSVPLSDACERLDVPLVRALPSFSCLWVYTADHTDVRVLNGGCPAWIASEGAVET